MVNALGDRHKSKMHVFDCAKASRCPFAQSSLHRFLLNLFHCLSSVTIPCCTRQGTSSFARYRYRCLIVYFSYRDLHLVCVVPAFRPRERPAGVEAIAEGCEAEGVSPNTGRCRGPQQLQRHHFRSVATRCFNQSQGYAASEG